MSRRKLRDDERQLWDHVARTATPLDPERRKNDGARIGKPAAAASRPSADPLPAFTIGEQARPMSSAARIEPDVSERTRAAPVNMDFKTYKRMKRGKLKPEGRIDLHGMTIVEAHPALNRFILSAQAEGKRLVLVITGKGRRDDDGGPIPRRVGVLRHEVPRWLSSAPLAAFVQQVTPASDRHGGRGAYYVYLRRR